jgi:hypothetical protein
MLKSFCHRVEIEKKLLSLLLSAAKPILNFMVIGGNKKNGNITI